MSEVILDFIIRNQREIGIAMIMSTIIYVIIDPFSKKNKEMTID